MSTDAEKTFLCKILSPETTLFSEHVEMVVAPAFDGEMGILKGHTQLVAQLSCGECRLVQSGKTLRYYVESGVVKVKTHGKGEALTTEVILLTDVGMPADNLKGNKETLEEELKKAEEMVITDERSFEKRSFAIRAAQSKLKLLSTVSSDKDSN